MIISVSSSVYTNFYLYVFKDVKTATEMGIAVYTIGGPCTEEVADIVCTWITRAPVLRERQGGITLQCRRWLLGLGRLRPGPSSVARPATSLAGLSKIAKNAPTTKAARGQASWC